MKRLWLYIGAVDLMALIFLAYALRESTSVLFFQALIIATFVSTAEFYSLDIFNEGDLTLTALINIVSLMTLGLYPTIMGDVIGIAVFGIIRSRSLEKTLFNAGQVVISTSFAYILFVLAGGIQGKMDLNILIIPIADLIINTLLVAKVFSIIYNASTWQTFLNLNRGTLPYSLIISFGGVTFGGIILAYSWIGVFLSTIMAISLWQVLYQAGYSISSMKKRYRETISVLTTALEFRDTRTHGHSQRVASWCKKIAEEMQLYPGEVDKIELGGLMHDVGKVGVPDHILNKPGRLTKEEYDEVKNHTVIGEKILSELKGMEYVAAMARQHHLFYNGDVKGYPDSLPSSKALLGSRILSVADSWDAMTGDRSYRHSLTIYEAVEELRVNSGIQFDPEVVTAFINVLKAEGVYKEESVLKARRATRETENDDAGITAC